MGLPPFVKSDGFISGGFIEDEKREQIDSSSTLVSTQCRK